MSPKYDNEDGNRNKRAHQRLRGEKKGLKNPDNETPAEVSTRRNKEQIQTAYTHNVEKVSEQIKENQPERRLKSKRPHHIRRHVDERKDNVEKYNQHETDKQQSESGQRNTRHYNDQLKYVPYEQGSGVREHKNSEVTAAASVPRLFWEPSTGHVVDRNTGQAYVLQPITIQN